MLWFRADTLLPPLCFLHASVLAGTSSSVGQWRQALTHVDIRSSFLRLMQVHSDVCSDFSYPVGAAPADLVETSRCRDSRLYTNIYRAAFFTLRAHTFPAFCRHRNKFALFSWRFTDSPIFNLTKHDVTVWLVQFQEWWCGATAS